jgi:hypothetical protein
MLVGQWILGKVGCRCTLGLPGVLGSVSVALLILLAAAPRGVETSASLP